MIELVQFEIMPAIKNTFTEAEDDDHHVFPIKVIIILSSIGTLVAIIYLTQFFRSRKRQPLTVKTGKFYIYLEFSTHHFENTIKKL